MLTLDQPVASAILTVGIIEVSGGGSVGAVPRLAGGEATGAVCDVYVAQAASASSRPTMASGPAGARRVPPAIESAALVFVYSCHECSVGCKEARGASQRRRTSLSDLPYALPGAGAPGSGGMSAGSVQTHQCPARRDVGMSRGFREQFHGLFLGFDVGGVIADVDVRRILQSGLAAGRACSTAAQFDAIDGGAIQLGELRIEGFREILDVVVEPSFAGK